MIRGPRGWLGRLKSLGSAFGELLQAELDALASELKGSAVLLRSGLIALAVAAFFVFWTLGALAFGIVEVLALWLPRWGAVLTCTGLLALLALIFGLVGRARLKKLESPAKTVARRVESHSAWVQSALLSEGSAGAESEDGQD